MNLFAALRQRRQPAQGFGQAKAAPEADFHQTFILEPILTPSGLVDVGEDIPEVADLDLGLDLDTDTEEGFDPVETDPIDGEGLAEANLEEIPFIENLDIDFQFESGYFTVGESGEVTIDYLFDGGEYQGELAIFSLEGMEGLEPGSEAFIQTAADRALSNSELGYIVISDQTEGARFSGKLGETDKNSGDYLGAKSFQMKPGDKFGFMLVPKGEVAEVADNPGIGGAKTPLFSLVEANPGDDAQLGQIVDVTGDGNTFVFEDLRTDGKSDRDYNDLIFQVRGATGEAALMDDFVDPAKDWRHGDLGQALITYAEIPAGIDATIYDFPAEDQPFVGVLDTGFSGNNPDLDYSRIQLGKDWVDGDNNPLLADGEGNEHGTHTLGLIAAEQGNNLGIDGLNDDAPLWVGRAIGSGQWHESLREFVDAAQDSGQPNAVINLSLDLTQIDGEGNVTTRYEFTPQEREAIEYARQNGVLLVAAAGNDGGVMSVLGQAAQEFDNILTVGAVDGLSRAAYSSYGNGLGLLAAGGTPENPVVSLMADGLGTMAGTSVATAQVTGAVSQVWAANPQLSYRQVIEILQATATDLDAPGWDAQTGAGLLNLSAAVLMAKATVPQNYGTPAIESPDTWSGEGVVTPSERAANPTAGNGGVVGTVGQGFRRPYQVRPGDSLISIAVRQLNDGGRWGQIQRADGSTFGAIDAALVPGDVVYLPVQYQQGTGVPLINLSTVPISVSATSNLGVDNDFNGDGKSDVLWRNDNGQVHVWLMDGTTKSGYGNVELASLDWQIEGTGDFNGDGKSDVLWRNDNGQVHVWLMDGTTKSGYGNVELASLDWQIEGTGDFNGDGKGDVLWRNDNGQVHVWLMDGTTKSGYGNVELASLDWQIEGTGDFNGDGKSDVLWRNDNGQVHVWLMDGTSKSGYGNVELATLDWQIEGTGDFNGDGKSDVLWRNDNGQVHVWLMDRTSKSGYGNVELATLDWQIEGTGDFNGDGKSDVLWRNDNGQVHVWLMDRTSKSGYGNVELATLDWQIFPDLETDLENDNSATNGSWQNPLDPGTYTIRPENRYRTPQRPNHNGIDLSTWLSNPYVPVKAAKPGQIIEVGNHPGGWGTFIRIQHDNGLRTVYAHLSSVNVSEGDRVNGGQKIGNVGSTGNSTGPHLHFEVHVAPYRHPQDTRNPENYIQF